MKKILLTLCMIAALLCGCNRDVPSVNIAATTLPVYEFTARICAGTDLTVTRLVTESVSCLHDYSLQVDQMRAIEQADVVILSGAGLEEFLEDALSGADQVIDCSDGIELICSGEEHDHGHDHHEEGHHHENDPHIWLSPVNASSMAQTICTELSKIYPQYADTFSSNYLTLQADLADLHAYGQNQLMSLSCRDLITFHDGFAYLAQEYDLHILEAVEEESGSEASAAELIELIEITEHHHLPAIFTEVHGSVSAADIIHGETGAEIFTLDMAMAGDSYFDAMYHNIDTLKEALG